MKKLLLLLVFMGIYANAQIVNIPDANFKAKLLSASPSNQIASTQTPDINGNVASYNIIDTSGDGEIQVSEAQAIKCLKVNGAYSVSGNIVNMIGIESFTNLEYLNCQDNQITNLNVSNLTNLKVLYCLRNQLVNLNVFNLVNLQRLDCQFNQLTNLDVSTSSNLQLLYCSYNQLLNLDVSNLIALQELYCRNNQLTSLNMHSLTNLQVLVCFYNQLTNLDFSNLTNLISIGCGNNQIQSLDVSNLTNLLYLNCEYNQLTNLNLPISLHGLICSNNQLTSINTCDFLSLNMLSCNGNQLQTLFIKNNNFQSNTDLGFSNNPNLQYICADEEDIAMVQQKITDYGYTNCHVNSYCSFTPGGTYYTINGANHYDENNNGCDAGDIAYPNLKINIDNGTTVGGLIGNTTGSYFYDVQAGTYILTPQLENPAYFNVSPATASVIFPDQVSPFTQDYCVSTNGTHHDLEVTVIPTNIARPGFDANYKIIYKNKGTNTETATLNFNYDDAVLDFVSATTTPTTQNVGNLVWSLGTIQPFQSGEIMLMLNLNSPMETPPLNAGNMLNYSAIINGAFTDETPIDNTFNLPQNVVNSYDPNDKTCLEGQTISNSMIGEYVHYMIRFENTGTYPAQNIVVKDMIDTTKFDVSTLQMTKASHDCYTRINGNKVEFIFENINLPFDDANNDGYVVFKIKTLPTLAQNSSVSNTADIFFDYNFPITTNTATTNFANLTTQNVAKAQVSVYPNPAKNVVNIKSENEINSISIFDIQGRQVQTKIVGATETILDISSLQQGNYLLKINTDKGIATEKIVKE